MTKRVSGALCALATGVLLLSGPEARTEAAEPKVPLWPYPHEVSVAGGECDLQGKAICIPAGANEKSSAVAEALSGRLAAGSKLPCASILDWPEVEIRGVHTPPTRVTDDFRALALIGCREADKEIAVLLDSKDADTRYRAAIALTVLGSPETKRLEMLARLVVSESGSEESSY